MTTADDIITQISGVSFRIKSGNRAIIKDLHRILPSDPDPKRNSFKVTIHDKSIPAGANTADNDLTTLNGYDEYTGFMDFQRRSAVICLTSRNQLSAALNALRQTASVLLFRENALILHASSVVKKNEAYIFAGRSGAGKSTICSMSPGLQTLSDDLTVIRKTGKSYSAWGMPALTRHDAPATPIPFDFNPRQVKALFLIRQDTRNLLTPVPAANAIAAMLALPPDEQDENSIGKLLEILADLTNHVPVYELHFTKAPDFWDCISNEFKADKS